MAVIETDYLVIGAGAAGMAFTDSLITDSDADVVMVERRDRPGGHWNNAYPFVRLHQASAFYGVNSRVLGTDAIDEVGPERRVLSPGDRTGEICDYFHRVLEEHLLPSGQVRFFGMRDCVDNGSNGAPSSSRASPARTTIRAGASARSSTPRTSRPRCRPRRPRPSDVDPRRAL